MPPNKAKARARAKAKSKKNLKQWAPGQSGNMKGRPKGKLSLTSQIKKMADWVVPDSLLSQYRQLFPQLSAKPTFVEVLALRTLTKALDIKTGDVMLKEIWERVDGKVPFPIQGSADPDAPPVRFNFTGLSTKELDIFERLLSRCQQEE